MGISDFLKSLSDKASQAVSPGLEETLSAVPALIGAYEQGRGRPIGGVLSTLGQWGMGNAANRQQKHQEEGDFAARLNAEAAQGHLPTDFYSSGAFDAISGPNVSAKAADSELTDIIRSNAASQKEQLAQSNEIAKEQRLQAGREALKKSIAKRGLSAPVKDQLAAMGADPETATPQQIQEALNRVQGSRASQAGMNMQAKARVLPGLPISMTMPSVAAYKIGSDGSYSPTPTLFATGADFQNGKVGLVPKSEQASFSIQQSSLKILDRFEQNVKSKATAGHYIPTKPGLQSYMGEPMRELVRAYNPDAAARPDLDATALADMVNKDLTNRTIASQLSIVRAALLAPHGTVTSTLHAIDEARQIIREHSQSILEQGEAAAGGDSTTFITGAPPAIAAPPTATPAPKPFEM